MSLLAHWAVLLLKSGKIPFTLLMAETKTTILVFWFRYHCSAGFQGKRGFTIADKISTYRLFIWERFGQLLQETLQHNILEGMNYCNVLIAADLPWKERIFRFQLQFLSRRCVGVNDCDVIPLLYRF